ncbi:MAG: hypothetical protein WA252_09395 [Candidatus Sulfotelmatobacter sp.]
MKICTVVLLWSAVASAACVNGHPTVQNEYGFSTFVLIGKVVGSQAVPMSVDGYFLDGNTFKLVPVRVFKGNVKRSIVLFSENSSGRFPMQVGKKYLVFAYTDHGRLMINNCGSSNLVSRAKKAVATVAHLSSE